MIAIVLLGLLACASAAPKRGNHHRHHHHRHGYSHYEDDRSLDDYSDRNIESQKFDTGRLWVQLSKPIMRLDTKLTDLSKSININQASTLIDDDDKEYKIFIQLQGFLEKEILIKVKNGLLFVQAIREVVSEPNREYFNIITLPDNVGEKWNWIYKNGLLKIVFPITQVEKEIPTQMTAPDQSMELSGVEPHSEEMSNNESDKDHNQIFFGTNGDLVETNKQQQGFETNETPGYENTIDTSIYTVDLNDDMQLVPMPRDY